MRILSFSLKLILFALVATFVVPGCKDDDDAKPDTATIHGTITLQNASLWDTWKDSGDVELSLFSEFVLALPPDGKGWGYIPLTFSEQASWMAVSIVSTGLYGYCDLCFRTYPNSL
jgi:hypothetical protein